MSDDRKPRLRKVEKKAIASKAPPKASPKAPPKGTKALPKASPKAPPKAPGISPARLAAFRILMRVERDAAFAAPLLASERLDELSSEDRRLAHELVLGVLRWRGELDYLVNTTTERPAEKLDLPVRIALWLGLYQIRHLERIPEHAAVSESVELLKNGKQWRAAPLVNAALRKAIRDRPDAPDARVQSPVNRLAIATSHPAWMVERWLAEFGKEETEALARADNEHPSAAFRINALRAPSTSRVLEELVEAQVDFRDSEVAPGGYVVTRGAISPASRVVRQGWIYLQDEASQLVAALVGARAGERVLDVGAAPGGKSTAIAAAMGNDGLVVAVDLYPARLATLRETTERLAARIVRPVAADASIDLPLAADATFDRVLVDAPCSGTGTLRRNPEIKWRLAPEDIAQFGELQERLVEQASSRVKPGGRLVYSTCSIEREENESVVERFLERHPEFALADREVPDALRTERGYLRTFPNRQGCDGFFAAVMLRAERE
jgi:16S rRNA (cytosine967-C5)-methyltransferase